MGSRMCCSPCAKESLVLDRIIDCIDRDDTTNLVQLLKILSIESKEDFSHVLNAGIIPFKRAYVNALAYSAYRGKARTFQHLISIGASVELMDESFCAVSISTISLICEKGYLEILKIYLPIYLSFYYSEKSNSNKSSSLYYSKHHADLDCIPLSYTPVQIACSMGYVNIIIYLHEYFNENMPPYLLDVHSVNEITGENCALIAVKNGNYIMMKVLHEITGADFHMKNINNEGALQVIAAATKNNGALKYLECIMYLVEVIKIDITYMHEEILLVLENKIIIKYIEEKLKYCGVIASKKEIETLYKFKNRNSDATQDIKTDSNEISAIIPESSDTPFSGSNFSKFSLTSK